MLKQWERQFPGRIDAIFGAIKNVAPSQLADTELFDFAGLTQGELEVEQGENVEIESFIRAINV
jgi:tRNA 2-thiocytidine biosynthesis protein TtcA